MKKLVVADPKMRAMIEFFGSQGLKFVDHETGEELTADGYRENEETNK